MTIGKTGRPHAIRLVSDEPHVCDGGTTCITVESIERMAKAGMSISESARSLGVPKTTYREFLVRNGLRDLYPRCME